MQTCIALLRGINVGGNNMVPTKDLRLLVEQLLGVRATARNWRTVTTLLEMTEGARA